MECGLPIMDQEHEHETSALLSLPSPRQVQKYFDNLLAAREEHGIKVKESGEFGKGVFANADFEAGELLFRDQILVGSQHSYNKMECLVCSFCFRFIGSIELQVARRLYFAKLGVFDSGCIGNIDKSQISDSCSNFCSSQYNFMENCVSSHPGDGFPFTEEAIQLLMNAKQTLPHTSMFILPSVESCHGGCKEAYYCSEACAKSDWETFHSLLCTGEKSESLSIEALERFIEHANETNDIFLVAAKAISFVILRYKKLKSAIKHPAPNDSCNVDMVLLLEAWEPLSMGNKRRWWDSNSVTNDVGDFGSTQFRDQMREMAFTSLQLLRAAIFYKECAPLFSLEIYSHIIGMFELNNLDLIVVSPVENYFLYIDQLRGSEKEAAEKTTKPFLDAVGGKYWVRCEGTAFYPLQSCLNHSCCPNSKAFKRDEDNDGHATIISMRHITNGEEVTISYIDEELPFDERQELLADYGFICRCLKCAQNL